MRKFTTCAVLIIATAICAHAQKITVGVFDNYPLMYKSKQGTFEGLFLDILEHIAKEKGWELEYKHGTAGECYDWLSTGEIDMIAEAGLSESHEKKYLLSQESILSTWARIYSHADGDITSFLDLENKRIAVLANSFFITGPNRGLKTLLSELDVNYELIEVSSYEEVFRMIENKEVDAGVLSRVHGEINEGDYNVLSTPLVFSPFRLGYAFSPYSQNWVRLNTIIDQEIGRMKADNHSYLNERINDYFTTKEDTTIPAWVWGILILFLIGIFQLLLYVLVLKKIVQKRTNSLIKALKEIQEREHLLALIYNNTKDFIALFEVTDNSSFVAKKLPNILLDRVLEIYPQYTADQILNMEISELYRDILEIDEGETSHKLEKIREALNTSQPVYFEEKITPLLKTNGTAESVMIPIELNGKISHILYVSKNVTEERESKKIITESEERMRLAVQNIPVMLDAFDETGNLLVWNKQCENVTGYTAEEMIGNPQAFEWLYPEKAYRNTITKDWENTHLDYTDVSVITCKDGSKRTISWIHQANSHPIPGWHDWGIGIDITEQKETEAALVRSENLLSSMMDNLPGMAWRLKIDKDFTMVFASKGTKELLNIPCEEFLEKGLKPRDFILKDYQNLVRQETYTSVKNMTPNELVIPIEVDGKIKWVLDRFKPVDLGNGEIVMDGMLIDITDKYESEQRLQMAIEGARQGMWDWDLENDKLELTQYASEILGFDIPLVENATEVFLSRVHPDDQYATRKAIDEHLQGIVEYYEGEYRIKTQQDNWKWIHTRGRVVEHSSDGKATRAIGTYVDIDIRKKTEFELIEKEKQLSSMMANLPGMVYRLDVVENYSLLFVSDGAQHIFGVYDKDIAGKGVTPWDFIVPEYHDSVRKNYQNHTESFEGAEQVMPITIKGKTKWVLDRFKAIKLENHEIVIDGVMLDITDKLDNERMLSSLMSNLPGMVYRSINDVQGTMEFVSAGALALTGYHPEEFESGQVTFKDITAEIDSDRIWREVEEALKENRPYTLIYKLKTKSNRLKWVWEQGSQIEGTKLLQGFVMDITDRIEAEEKIVSTVIETEDNERKRISKELHDSLGQKLTTALLNLNAFKKDMEEEHLGYSKLLTGLKNLNSAIKESRDIAHNLMPRSIENFGYVPSVQSIIAEVETVSGMNFEFYDNLKGERFDKQLEVHLYRITQEGINNILKYSQAKNVSIQLMVYQDDLILTIDDDGVGFDIDQVLKGTSNFGIRSMRNRVNSISGNFNIDSSPNSGTILTVEVPLKSKQHEH